MKKYYAGIDIGGTSAKICMYSVDGENDALELKWSWGVFVGVLSLKFSAYLQPVVHRLIQIIYKKRREKSK